MFVAELKNYWKKKGVQIDQEEDTRARELATSAQRKILGRTIMKARLDLLALLENQNKDGSFFPLPPELALSDFESLLFPSSSSLTLTSLSECLSIPDISFPDCLTTLSYSRTSFLSQFLSLCYSGLPPVLQQTLNTIPSASAVQFLISLITTAICRSLYNGLTSISGQSQTVVKNYMGSMTTTNVENIYDSSHSITIDKLLQKRSLTDWDSLAFQFLSSFFSTSPSSSSEQRSDSLSLSSQQISTVIEQISHTTDSYLLSQPSPRSTSNSGANNAPDKLIEALCCFIESLLKTLYSSQQSPRQSSISSGQPSEKLTETNKSPNPGPGSHNNSPNSLPKTAPMRRMFFALQKEWDPQFRSAPSITPVEGAEYPINVHYIFKIPSTDDVTSNKIENDEYVQPQNSQTVIVKTKPQRLLGGEFQFCRKISDDSPKNKNETDDEDCLINHSISLVSKLGSGTFATVYDGIWKIDSQDQSHLNDPVDQWKLEYLHYQLSNKIYSVEPKQNEKREIGCAVKAYSSQISGDDQMVFLNELHILSRLSHPHVINILAANIQPPNYCMVMRTCPNGTLYNLLHSYSDLRPWWPDMVLTVAYDIALALEYLHKEGVVHRDIKSLNVLLREDNRALLCDFGVATFLKANETLSTNIKVGSPYYMSPEIIRRHPYAHQADIYSFGVMMWEILLRDEPYLSLSSELPAINGWETIVNRVASEHLRPSTHFSQTPIKFVNNKPNLSPTLSASPPSTLTTLSSLSREISNRPSWFESDPTLPLRQLIELMWSDSPSDRPSASSLVGSFSSLASLFSLSLPDLRIRPPPPLFSRTCCPPTSTSTMKPNTPTSTSIPASTTPSKATSTPTSAAQVKPESQATTFPTPTGKMDSNQSPTPSHQHNNSDSSKGEVENADKPGESSLFQEWKMDHFWEFICESRATKKSKKLVWIDPDYSLLEVLDLMLTNNILSVPVLQRVASSDQNNNHPHRSNQRSSQKARYSDNQNQQSEMEFRGTIDVWDIMKHFTFFEKYFDNFLIEEDSFLSHQFASVEIASILTQKYDSFRLRLRRPSLSRTFPPNSSSGNLRTPSDSVSTTGVSLQTAQSSLEHLGKLFTSGSQRLLMNVTNDNFSILDEFSVSQKHLTFGDLTTLAVVSQIDMLEWIYFNGTFESNESLSSDSVNRLHRILQSTLADVGINFDGTNTQSTDWWAEPLICVQEEDTTLAAFREMYVHNVRAVAVVNKDDQLVGALASKDLRYLSDEGLPFLRLPVIDFLTHFYEQYSDRLRSSSELPLPFGVSRTVSEREAKNSLLSSIVYCRPEDLVWEVIRKVLIKRVHRLWLVEPGSLVVRRMIPLTQLLQLFV